MVHLVALRATLPWQLPNIVNALRGASNGFYTLRDGLHIVVIATEPQPLRDWLRTLGASEVSVLRLQGDWATHSNEQLAQWLHGAAGFF